MVVGSPPHWPWRPLPLYFSLVPYLNPVRQSCCLGRSRLVWRSCDKDHCIWSPSFCILSCWSHQSVPCTKLCQCYVLQTRWPENFISVLIQWNLTVPSEVVPDFGLVFGLQDSGWCWISHGTARDEEDWCTIWRTNGHPGVKQTVCLSQSDHSHTSLDLLFQDFGHIFFSFAISPVPEFPCISWQDGWLRPFGRVAKKTGGSMSD